MTKLVFGVNDVPYVTQMSAPEVRAFRWRHRKKPWQSIPSRTTTGDVAEILERRYHVMQTYYEVHQDDIVGELESVLQGKLESLLMGGPAPEALFASGDLSGVEEGFRRFLDQQEMDGRAPGVPTQAALRGVSHRFRHPYARRGPRPSFVDTGQYRLSFRAEVQE